MNDLTVLDNRHPTQGESLLRKLRQAEAAVRREPAEPEHRWTLVETLCLLCQWERALQQLQAWVRLAPQWQAQAQLVRGLIQAEHQRTLVFGGQQRAAPVVDMPEWMALMAKALEHNAAGEVEQADACRHQALEQAPGRSGVCHWDARTSGDDSAAHHEQAFEWLADSDTRLGPVCELMVAGAYRWLAFADIASIQMEAPARTLDLVWRPARIQLHGDDQGSAGRHLHAFLPSRSCWVQVPAEPREQQQALMQARLTLWQEAGSSGIFVQGQKTWMSDGIDWPLLDVREVRT